MFETTIRLLSFRLGPWNDLGINDSAVIKLRVQSAWYKCARILQSTQVSKSVYRLISIAGLDNEQQSNLYQICSVIDFKARLGQLVDLQVPGEACCRHEYLKVRKISKQNKS